MALGLNIPDFSRSPYAKTKPGQPSQNQVAVTYETQKMTFYIKGDLMKRLRNFAYWERQSLTQAFNAVLQDGLKSKNTKPKP